MEKKYRIEFSYGVKGEARYYITSISDDEEAVLGPVSEAMTWNKKEAEKILTVYNKMFIMLARPERFRIEPVE